MTTKRKYEKPATQVFELKHQPKLLAGSDSVVTATMNDEFEEIII